ncbi:MAG: nucleotidyltransferase domain-containing protein [Chloroflexi bacterium]|nr:nucleotidyltransferase domain-containing protein [Chloroflexota bacterium]
MEFDQEALAALCRKWHIKRLALFGSVMRDDFGPDSDVDVLYEFEEDARIGWAIVDVIEELSALFGGRKVDFVAFKYINRRLRPSILAGARTVYEAA